MDTDESKKTSEEEKKDTQTGETTTDTKGQEEKKEETYSKAQLENAKNESVAAVYKEFGIDPNDKKAVNMFKAFLASQKTDEEKAAEKANEDKKRQLETEERLAIAEAKAEAMVMGVQSQYVDDIVTLALAKMKSQKDAEIKSVISELKKKYPVWFNSSDSEENKGKKGTGSTISTNKNNNNKDEEEKGLGARLAALRKGEKKKSSYWSN